MRGDRSVPRGEAGRVALRVREVLGASAVRDAENDDDGYDDDGYDDAQPISRWQRLQARVPVRLDPGRRAAWGMGAAVLVAALVSALWLLSSRPASVPVAARVPQVPGATLGGTGTGFDGTGFDGTGSDGTGSDGTGSDGTGSDVTGSDGTGSGRPGSTGSGAAAGGVGSGAASSSSPAGTVVVDVAGKVRRPGVYRLPVGSRVDDAVAAAGGAGRGVDLTSLNLAAPVSDGQQILVGVAGAGAGGQVPVSSTGPGGSAPSGSGSPVGPVDLNTATLDQLDALPGVGPVLAQHVLDWRGEHGRFTTVDQLNDVSGIGDVKFAALKPLVTV